MKNILVIIDFKKNEELLINKSVELAKPFNSKIWLLHITAPDSDFVSYDVGPQYIRDFRGIEIKKEHKQIQEYASRLKKEGIDADGLLIQGTKIEMILEESKKLNIDLIITGHHKHSFFYKLFSESISSEIQNQSKIPVLIVPL